MGGDERSIGSSDCNCWSSPIGVLGIAIMLWGLSIVLWVVVGVYFCMFCIFGKLSCGYFFIYFVFFATFCFVLFLLLCSLCYGVFLCFRFGNFVCLYLVYFLVL